MFFSFELSSDGEIVEWSSSARIQRCREAVPQCAAPLCRKTFAIAHLKLTHWLSCSPKLQILTLLFTLFSLISSVSFLANMQLTAWYLIADKFWSKIGMSAKGNAPNRRVAAIQAKKKRKQPKKSKTVGEGGQGWAGGKDRDRPARETRQEQEQSRSFEEVSINFLFPFILTHCMSRCTCTCSLKSGRNCWI